MQFMAQLDDPGPVQTEIELICHENVNRGRQLPPPCAPMPGYHTRLGTKINSMTLQSTMAQLDDPGPVKIEIKLVYHENVNGRR
jgi:hypothetical protein